MLDQISPAIQTRWPISCADLTSRAAWVSNTGLIRAHNEDTCLIDDRLGLYVLADGMGGYNAGEVASRIAVDEIRHYMADHLIYNESTVQREEMLSSAICFANDVIQNTAKKRPECLGMGTTAVVALVDKSPRVTGGIETVSVTLAHMGDSRCYLYSSSAKRLSQLTKDHSLGQELADRGAMKGSELAKFAMRGVLTRALGAELNALADTVSFTLSPTDLILLCSDGLSDMLSDIEIQAQVQQHCAAHQNTDLKALGDSLIAMALGRGGNDNVSAMIVSMAEV
jgi:PPM family protein phosphatase